MELIIIIVSVITGCGALTGASYKLYRDFRQNNHQVEQQVPVAPPPSPVIDRIVKDVVRHQLQKTDGYESDTETEININIRTHHKDQEE